VGYRITGAPTSRRLYRRLMPLSYRLTIVRVAHPLSGFRRTKSASAVAIAASARSYRLAPASAFRCGRLVGDNHYVVSRSRLLPLSQKYGVVCGSVSRAEDYKDCRNSFRQNQPRRYSENSKDGGKPLSGSCPFQAGEASLNDAPSAPTAVESGFGCLCRRAGEGRRIQQRVL